MAIQLSFQVQIQFENIPKDSLKLFDLIAIVKIVWPVNLYLEL